MGAKQKQALENRRASFKEMLNDRLSALSGKGIARPQADKDTLVRKLQARVRAVNNRLRAIADGEKRAQDAAKAKAAAKAAPKKDQEGGEGEKPRKAAVEGKEKKPKPEKKSAAPKTKEGGPGGKAEGAAS